MIPRHELRGARRRAGATLRDIAIQARYPLSHLSEWERGGGNPSLAQLSRVCAAIDTTPIERVRIMIHEVLRQGIVWADCLDAMASAPSVGSPEAETADRIVGG